MLGLPISGYVTHYLPWKYLYYIFGKKLISSPYLKPFVLQIFLQKEKKTNLQTLKVSNQPRRTTPIFRCHRRERWNPVVPGLVLRGVRDTSWTPLHLGRGTEAHHRSSGRNSHRLWGEEPGVDERTDFMSSSSHLQPQYPTWRTQTWVLTQQKMFLFNHTTPSFTEDISKSLWFHSEHFGECENAVLWSCWGVLEREPVRLIRSVRSCFHLAWRLWCVQDERVPWGSILTSMPVHALNICNFARSWVFFLLLTNEPAYLNVFDFTIAQVRFATSSCEEFCSEKKWPKDISRKHAVSATWQAALFAVLYADETFWHVFAVQSRLQQATTKELVRRNKISIQIQSFGLALWESSVRLYLFTDVAELKAHDPVGSSERVLLGAAARSHDAGGGDERAARRHAHV